MDDYSVEKMVVLWDIGKAAGKGRWLAVGWVRRKGL